MLTFRYKGETQDLDEAARSSAPGQFVTLSRGMVHYELKGPSDAQTVVLIPGPSWMLKYWMLKISPRAMTSPGSSEQLQRELRGGRLGNRRAIL